MPVLALIICFLRTSNAIRLPALDRSDAFVGYTERSDAKGPPQSQRIPNPGCIDRDPGCARWAADGECDKNAGFMLSSCRRACTQCTDFVEAGAFAGKNVSIVTSAGQIHISLFWTSAPESCAQVAQLAAANHTCSGCEFYRAEPVAPVGSQGPPYGLLQGVLAGLERPPPHEAPGSPIKRGSVATIHPGKDFYIALTDHRDWEGAHTVWGTVQDMDAVDTLVRQPVEVVHHPTYGTAMRMLLTRVPFHLELAADS